MANKKINLEWVPQAYQTETIKAEGKPLTPIAPIIQSMSIYSTKKSAKNKKSGR